jgi:oxygen-independent coproporphyrinogen-3 oxidase
VFPRELEREYLRALRGEMSSHDWERPPETVYLGGGTPASMNSADLAELLAIVPGRPWREATIEAAPGSIRREQAEVWREAGINRVSMGVQSFDDSELRRTGRRHDAAGVARDVALLRECGLGEISVDLIVGLPGQTEASWGASLDWVARLDVAHVSVYMLEVDEDSRLGREILGGGLRYGAGSIPRDDDIARFYEIAVERLASAGLRRYEISNFARPGHESLHNLKYWRLEPYVGFGADAHSFDGAVRWRNAETAEEYVRDPRRMEATPACAREERFFVGLRLLEGVVPTAEEAEYWREPIARLVDAGLLERAGERLRLTDRGVLLSNEVFEEFIVPCPSG